MQVSVETTSQIERRITIQVPAADIDEAVSARLKDTAKNVRLNGFRQGRVPMAVVRQRYGDSVRSEVVGEVMRERYVRAITDEGFNPAGYPQIEPVVNEEPLADAFESPASGGAKADVRAAPSDDASRNA